MSERRDGRVEHGFVPTESLAAVRAMEVLWMWSWPTIEQSGRFR